MLAVSDQVEQELKERLMEIRENANTQSLCLHGPEKWLAVAVSVYRGEAVRKVMRDHNIGQTTYYNVRKEILDIQKKYVEFQVNQIDANIDAADNSTADMLEVLQGAINDMKDNMEDGLSYDKAKTTEAITSALDRLQKAAVSMSMRKGKLLDKPDIVVEQRGPKIDYEARKKELLAMRKAEAIDITEEEYV